MKNKPIWFLDTNVFIYFFEDNVRFGPQVKKLFSEIVTGRALAVTTVITQLELLSLRMPEEEAEKLLMLFLEMPNLRVENITSEIAIEAARIRRQYNFRTPDAIQLAVAVRNTAHKFITNDKRLKRFSEVKIVPL